MFDINENHMRRCYELAISAGKKGFDTFGAVLVYDGKILEEAENTADFEKKFFGHAEFNLVHKCANKYTDDILEKSVVYTSCAPCERCLAAIASRGVHQIVCGVSYKEFCKLLPFDYQAVDREGLLKKLGIKDVKAVYSEEEPIKPAENPHDPQAEFRRSIPASNAFVPSVAGLIAAGEVIKDLAKIK